MLKDIEYAGYRRIILKSNQEPAMKAVKRRVRDGLTSCKGAELLTRKTPVTSSSAKIIQAAERSEEEERES